MHRQKPILLTSWKVQDIRGTRGCSWTERRECWPVGTLTATKTCKPSQNFVDGIFDECTHPPFSLQSVSPCLTSVQLPSSQGARSFVKLFYDAGQAQMSRSAFDSALFSVRSRICPSSNMHSLSNLTVPTLLAAARDVSWSCFFASLVTTRRN